MTEPRAIVFDLDDTLYPYAAFVRSGFRTVARTLAREHGLPVCQVLRALRRAFAGGDRGRELQALCERFALPDSLVPVLVAVIRGHVPSLRLPQESKRVLLALRRSWRVGVLTNGTPVIQKRKIHALGLGSLVDVAVCAAECGDGAGKPAAAAFQTVLERLDARAENSVFVGDDPAADIAGAAAVGMRSIHVVIGDGPTPTTCGRDCQGIHVRTLEEVPRIAQELVPMRTARYAF